MTAKRTRQALAVTIIALLLLSLVPLNARSSTLGNLQVSFLDVGQGDSALLRDANGFDVLIDGGQPFAGPTVAAYLREQGVDGIDVLVASHSDADHIGGLITVLRATDIPIYAVVVNGYTSTSQTWATFLEAIAERGLTPTLAQFPSEFLWGEMTVHMLNPIAGLSSPASNDASLVLRVDHGEVNFLFTGDIPSAIEAQVIERGTPVAVEILKVAHHGSAYSSSSSFLGAVGAQDSIISVGDNTYGHPAPDALARLAAAGSAVWRTDQNGNILVISDGLNYSITSGSAAYAIFLPLVHAIPSTAATPTPEPAPGNLIIQFIFTDGTGSSEPDEYVVIENIGEQAVSVQGWTLRDIASHIYTFPAFSMQPHQVCRVYTNQNNPASCGFNYGSSSAIWNNSGDCASLRNAQGHEVSQFCY